MTPILKPDTPLRRDLFTAGELAILLASAVVSLGILIWAWGKGV